MRRLMRSIAVVVLGGVVTAVALFGVTSQAPTYGYLGPLCATRTVVNPGFDPWTGEPYGRTYECIDILADEPSTRLVTDEAPDDLIGRPVVPLPVGFVLGAFITLVWLTARSITEADAGGRGNSGSRAGSSPGDRDRTIGAVPDPP